MDDSSSQNTNGMDDFETQAFQPAAESGEASDDATLTAEAISVDIPDVFTKVKSHARDVEARKLRGTAKVIKKDELNALIAQMVAVRMRGVEEEKAQAFEGRQIRKSFGSEWSTDQEELRLGKIERSLSSFGW